MGREEFTALLGTGTEYQGQLNFKGTVRVDGKFIGDITSERKLILGREGVIEGNVTVNELVVHGSITGELRIHKRTILHQSARVVGTLTTPALAMEEGGIFQGQLIMASADPIAEKNSTGFFARTTKQALPASAEAIEQ